MARISLTVVLLMILSACTTQQPIHNVSDSLVPTREDGTLLTRKEVKSAIMQAATYKRWKPVSIDEDTIEAKITVRDRHHARIHIDYSQLSYSITLQSSEGLDEQGGQIHRNYNKWIILLDEQIQVRLAATAMN